MSTGPCSPVRSMAGVHGALFSGSRNTAQFIAFYSVCDAPVAANIGLTHIGWLRWRRYCLLVKLISLNDDAEALRYTMLVQLTNVTDFLLARVTDPCILFCFNIFFVSFHTRHFRGLSLYKDNLRDMSAAFSETRFLFCDVYPEGPKSANDFCVVRVSSSGVK